MKEYPQPRTVKEAQSFLGIVSWLRRFIPRCATLTTNIRKCISDSPKKFNLSDQVIKEVEILKEIITSDTCLAHPRLNKQFYIHVDASKVGMGAILTQTDDQGHHRIVEYASKAMSQTQRKASNSTREAMGILWSLEHFRYYVHGKNPIVFCNCKCLSDILRSDSAPGTAALRNWVAQVLHFRPKVIHKPGTMMAIPDALSRHYVTYMADEPEAGNDLLGSLFDSALKYKNNIKIGLKKQKNLLDKMPNQEIDEMDGTHGVRTSIDLLVMTRSKTEKSKKQKKQDKNKEKENEEQYKDMNAPIDPQQSHLAQEQRADEQLIEIIEFLNCQKLPRTRNRATFVCQTAHQYIIDDIGILRKIDLPIHKESTKAPAMLPRHMWDATIKLLHDTPINGHRKFDKLYDLFKRMYYFPGMGPYIKAYCETCERCQISTSSKALMAPLHPIEPSYPGVVVHLDSTKGGPLTERGYSHILAIIEAFSGHVRLYPLGDPDGQSMAKLLLKYIAIHSMPLKVITDNGPECANQLMTELAYLLGMKQTKISPYNSKANGKVENIHKTVKTMLRAYMKEFKTNWDLLLPLVEFAMNTSRNVNTGYTPFFLHFGRHLNMPLDYYYGDVHSPKVTVDEYVQELQTEQENVINWVRKFKTKNSLKMKQIYDKKHKNQMSSFQVGDKCRLNNPQRKGELPAKFNDLYSRDIYIVLEDRKNGSFLVQKLNRTEEPKSVHINRMKRIEIRHEINIDCPQQTIQAAPVETEIDDTVDYEVRQIIDKRLYQNKIQYKIWWKGYKKKQADWINVSKLNCEQEIQRFEETQKEKYQK